MIRWLSDFAYRIKLSWWIFVLAGLIALAVALLATGNQSVKAAMANPVSYLRMDNPDYEWR